jgi:hypothetical protein
MLLDLVYLLLDLEIFIIVSGYFSELETLPNEWANLGISKSGIQLQIPKLGLGQLEIERIPGNINAGDMVANAESIVSYSQQS